MATPIRFSASTVITGAFELIGVFQPGDSIPAADAQGALRRLNQLISAWSISPLTFPFVQREVFSTVANQSTYTIGPGGDFDTVRPTSLTGSGCLLPAVSNGTRVEIARPLLTDDAYEAIAIKNLTTGGNGQWTDAYFNPEYADGLASIFLWPTPSTDDNDCVIYRGDAVQGFVTLSAEADFPPGYADALEYGLAERLLTPYGVSDPQVRSDVKSGALNALRLVKADNVKPADLALDPALTHDWRGGYNIQTGTGG